MCVEGLSNFLFDFIEPIVYILYEGLNITIRTNGKERQRGLILKTRKQHHFLSFAPVGSQGNFRVHQIETRKLVLFVR